MFTAVSKMALVGEGSHGCVHKPSLYCKKTGTTKGKISKTMKAMEAALEFSQYEMIHTADVGEEFHVGMPEVCDIDDALPSNKTSLLKCDIGREVLHGAHMYKLLVMKDGGQNLDDYSHIVRTWATSPESTHLCHEFLIETLRLFRGLRHFQTHGILLNDIKPQNIVYNGKRLNFIDFGMTKHLISEKKNLLRGSNNYEYSIFHWNFPWEMVFLNHRSNFESIAKVYKKLLRSDFNLEKGHYVHLNAFFSCRVNSNQRQANINYTFDDFDEFVDAVVLKELTYDEFVPMCMDTIDSYGLGLTLLNWLHFAEKHLGITLVACLSSIYQGMVCQNVTKRLTVEIAMNMFETVLKSSGILHGKVIVDHVVVDDDKQKVRKVTEDFVSDPKVMDARPSPSKRSFTCKRK